VLRHATLTDQNGGKLPSDHYPVVADLCIGNGC
jgi:endonuclease/exonuclease/phosphatase family metal-dependent hydrolase